MVHWPLYSLFHFPALLPIILLYCQCRGYLNCLNPYTPLPSSIPTFVLLLIIHYLFLSITCHFKFSFLSLPCSKPSSSTSKEKTSSPYDHNLSVNSSLASTNNHHLLCHSSLHFYPFFSTFVAIVFNIHVQTQALLTTQLAL